MDWDAVAPMIVAIVLIVSVSGTLVLRPLVKHLAVLLEAMARERSTENPRIASQLEQLRELIQTQGERMALLEERVEFTESLVKRQQPREIAPRAETTDAPGSRAT